MGVSDLPPRDLAEIDQGICEGNAQIDIYVLALQILTGEHGEDQALADLVAMFHSEHDSIELAMLAALAIRRIARS